MRVLAKRGAILLEVIVSIGLLVFGMVMVGLQINAGLDAARSSDVGTRAVMLADTKLSELDAGILQVDEYEKELKGDFGILYPGYTWRIELEPTDIDNFYMVTLEIGFNEHQVQEQIDDPDYEIDIEDDGVRIVRTVYRLCPKPADVDLERDFGFGEEEIDSFLEALDSLESAGAGVEEAAGSGDGVDVGSAADLIRDLLALSDTGSFDPRLLSQLPEEDFLMLAEMLESMFGRSGADALQRQFGHLLPGGGARSGRGGDMERPEGPGRLGRPRGPALSDEEGPPEGREGRIRPREPRR